MHRREFLRRAALRGGAAAVLGPRFPSALAVERLPRLAGGSILDLPAADAPIDTIVVLMMENR